ncbi:type II toxin-antitoxin system RelE/ParE family toxin [Vibrio sp. JC009]|uniref:type II toxin-antitoxin system RelE/ParE family toxin n=1 Tax=Vibrio sp. JC009 TaxID=2912314 RepID=UPI0023B14C17|nr:type II toxin-antitoxin system RelE/ParE family toxin [Vibrio sp. JC009]WED22653.1 type II toxin-antitoxin system RelE/ParE family toxin [Vibrio sp. JC009]
MHRNPSWEYNVPAGYIEDKPISHAIEFIETPIFESQRKELINDDEFRELQSDIIKNPKFGKLVIGTGGLRKIRLASSNTGKSGGYRVLYLLVLPDTVYLMMIYKKGRKDSLTNQDKNLLKEVSQSIKRRHANG